MSKSISSLISFRILLEINANRDAPFPPPCSSVLISSKLKLPTANEYPVNVKFIKQLTGVSEREVILFGTFDGAVFALTTEKELALRRVFQFPSTSPIFDFAVLYSIPFTRFAPAGEDVDICLVSVTTNGLLAAYCVIKRYAILAIIPFPCTFF